MFCASGQKLILQTSLVKENVGAVNTSLMGNNFRPIQPLHSRKITRPRQCNGAAAFRLLWRTASAMLLASYLLVNSV